MLKLLHNCLMRSCRVLPTRDDLVYINVGRTRTESKASRFIRDKSGAVVVSFCPFRSVDAETSRLCKIAVVRVFSSLNNRLIPPLSLILAKTLVETRLRSQHGSI